MALQEKYRWGASVKLFCAVAIALAAAVNGMAAHAADTILQPDERQWVSFDRLQDNHPPDTAEENLAAPSDLATQPNAKLDATTLMPEQTAKAISVESLGLSAMPGINKGFSLSINSTEDELPPPLLTPIPPNASFSVAGPSTEHWQNPAVITAGDTNTEGANNGDAPLNIRQSYLPARTIIPVPSHEHESVMIAAHIMARQNMQNRKPNGDTPKTSAEKAACTAIVAYKKQQLDAIQRDQKTLQALQEAIGALGLQKQLGFIANNGSLDALAPQSGGMEMPGSRTTVQ